MCQVKGCDQIANIVHHIKPIKQYPGLKYSIDNLMSCCRDCHERIEGRLKGGCDINGVPLDKGHHWNKA